VTEDSTYGAVFGQTLGYDLFFGSVNEESVEHWVNRGQFHVIISLEYY
jgi:hypothetical protein